MELPDYIPEHDLEMAIGNAKSLLEALSRAYIRGFYDGYARREEESND